MRKLTWAASVLYLVTTFMLVACAAEPATNESATTLGDDASPPPALPTATAATPTSDAEEPAPAGALALDEQAAFYISRLPRPADVPAGWRMDRTPQFQERSPAPGESYRFACEQLPARSVGLATVGYRSLDALPSMTIEYVVYPTEGDAAQALADMQQAAETCEQFALSGQAGDPPDARFAPLEFPSFGSSSFGAALTTDTETTGALLTHVIKIQSGNVVVGINHANWADQPPPETAVTEAMARLTLDYLARED